MTAQAYRNMVVPADHVDLARQICAALAPSGGFAMFGVGLSADGTAPATHYVSTGHIDAEFAGLMPLTDWHLTDEGVWVSLAVSPGAPEVVVALCAEAGLEVALADVEALFAESDVTEQEPFVAFARLGLQMINEDPAS